MRDNRSWSTLYINRDDFSSFRDSLRRCDRLSFRWGTFGFQFFENVEPAHWTERMSATLEWVFECNVTRRAMGTMFCLALGALILDAFLPR